MINIRKYGRTWHVYGDEALLDPWAKDIEQIPGKLLSRTGSKYIWQITADDGKDYFVKRERGFHLPFTKSKAEKDFRSFALLEEKGIPCTECSAWSATFDDSIIVTKALPEHFDTLLKYWYSSPEINTEFLQKLCDFLADVIQSGIMIPDLRMDNLATDGESIVILDPAGAVEADEPVIPAAEVLRSLEIAFGEVPAEQISEMLQKAGMYDTEEEAFTLLKEMEKEWEEQTEKVWEKCRSGLFSKRSDFVTGNGPGKYFRNTAWHTPLLQFPEGVLEEKEMPEHVARELWETSFRCQIRKKPCENIPVIYQKMGENVKISMLKDKKYSFFYGFH
ncbi:MAG: hypothetical protein E7040_04610 [Lentisphaerae bacterium]|nr:hypothetical protein [Lentisphaerota bacterium]